MTRNFFEREPMPGTGVGARARRAKLLPTVTLAELNQLAATWGDEKGRVISVTGPASAKLPTEEETRALFASCVEGERQPWADEARGR